MNALKAFFCEEDAVSTVEIILILIVLIALVVLFKDQLIRSDGNHFVRLGLLENRVYFFLERSNYRLYKYVVGLAHVLQLVTLHRGQLALHLCPEAVKLCLVLLLGQQAAEPCSEWRADG